MAAVVVADCNVNNSKNEQNRDQQTRPVHSKSAESSLSSRCVKMLKSAKMFTITGAL